MQSMDRSERTVLVAAVRGAPDPRQHRRQRYPRKVILAMRSAAIAGTVAAVGGRAPVRRSPAEGY